MHGRQSPWTNSHFISPQILVHWQLIWEILGEKGLKSGLSRGDKQGYWFHCHITFQEWCISGAIYQNGHWAWANNTITKHRSLLQKSHCKYFSAHLNVAKVNSLIVEMGTLCQPGEVTSGERQPKNTHTTAPNQYSTHWHCDGEKSKREREQKREKKAIKAYVWEQGYWCSKRTRQSVPHPLFYSSSFHWPG